MPPAVVRMQLLGGDPNARAAGVSPLVTRVNYFLGNDPNEWHTNIPTFAKVQYDDVYPGIDLVYYAAACAAQRSEVGGQRSEVGGERSEMPAAVSTQHSALSTQHCIEYDFIVSPGADPNQIQLSFTGADSVTLDAAGNLNLQTGDTTLRQNAPYIYQEANGTRQQVDGEFRIQNSECSGSTDYCLLSTDYSSPRSVTFAVDTYDMTRPLVIDPMVVSYSTYLGGTNYDYGYDIAVDKFGSAYVSGEAATAFPLKDPLQQYAGSKDAFVSKFSPDGSTLIYSTYIGGRFFDAADSIAIDVKVAAYITGGTQSDDFPATPGAFQPRNGDGTCSGSGCADAFITKLSPDGASLVYSTYLGTNYAEAGDGIAVDAAGNAYVMGLTNSPTFYTLNAVQPKYGGGSCDGLPCYDAFITKLNASGSALIYSTYLGGNRDEASFFHETGDIAVDAAGQAYVTGYTESANFPIHNAIQSTRKGFTDAYVTKLIPDGSAFVFSTYLGGSLGERGRGIVAGASGDTYVTGLTYSDDFPTTPDSFKPSKTGGGLNPDAFMAKLTSDGSTIVYSTFLGGSKTDIALALTTDIAGNAYVAGTTVSSDFPTRNAFQTTFAGGHQDAFVSKLSASGNLLMYSSYLGGGEDGNNGLSDGVDLGYGVAVDLFGNAYVTGYTYSSTFPTIKPFQPQIAGYADAFVTKISRFQRQSLVSQDT